jgi:hypothetical protein
MSKEVWIGKKGFRYWYYKFRDSELYGLTLLGVTIIISLFLFFNVIIPELNNWFSIRKEVIATRQQIAILQQNITFLNNLNPGVLNDQVQMATQALPAEKDFGMILNAISNASAVSGISLNDYTFQIGSIASSSAQAVDSKYNGLTSVELTVAINGNFNQTRKFVQSIQNSLPLSEVTAIDGSGEDMTIAIVFYQKLFPAVNFSADTPLTPVSADKVTLLQNLSKWEVPVSHSSNIQSGSGSAVPLF